MRYQLLFLLLFVICNSNAQQSETDSLLNILKTTKEDSVRFECYHSLSRYYWETNPDTSIYFGQLAYSISKDNTKKGLACKSLGIAYDYKGNLDSCLHYLQTALSLFIKENQYDKQASVINDIAIAYYYRGNYELALRKHLYALELRQKIGDKKYISVSYNNIGLIYRAKKDYPKAINYYQNSLKIKQEISDEQGMIDAYINIGSAFQSSGKSDSNYYFAQKAYLLAQKNNDKSDMIAAESNMAVALVMLNRPKEALVILERIEKSAADENNSNVLKTVYETYGDLYLKEKQYKNALLYFGKGLSLASSKQRKEPMEMFYRKIAKTHFLLGNYKLAYEQFEKSRALSDSMFNEENSRQMNELSAVYESGEKEKRIVQLNAEKLVANNESAQRKKERNYLILLTILSLCFALLAYRAFSTNKKKNELLNEKNSLIEKALDEKEFLMREIHHRVKNNLQMVSSLLSLQSNYIKDETALEAVNDSRNRVHSMSLIHQSLYGEEDLSTIEINDYVQKLVENLYQSYTINPDKIKLITDIDAMKLDVDTIIPIGLILNELITNCLKYAFPNQANGLIKVVFKENNGLVKLAVYDNGIGLPVNFMNEQKKTFGHKMINAFLKKLNGKINIYSEDGTKVDIEFPLQKNI